MTTDIDKLAQQMREAAAHMLKASRPCDCDRCYCGKPEDAAYVAAWDADKASSTHILALLDDRERLVAAAAAAKATMEMAATSGAFWSRRAESAEAAWEAKERECERLREALADAICRPKGVVPASAEGLVSVADLDAALRAIHEQQGG